MGGFSGRELLVVPETDQGEHQRPSCEGNISVCHGGKNQKLLLFTQLLIKVFFP